MRHIAPGKLFVSDRSLMEKRHPPTHTQRSAPHLATCVSERSPAHARAAPAKWQICTPHFCSAGPSAIHQFPLFTIAWETRGRKYAINSQCCDRRCRLINLKVFAASAGVVVTRGVANWFQCAQVKCSGGSRFYILIPTLCFILTNIGRLQWVKNFYAYFF